MNVIDLLATDHETVDELFRRFNIAEKPETKEAIARSIVHELSVHAAVEEQFLYPLVRLKVGDEVAGHAIEEHAEVKELLTQVEKNEAGTSEHDAAMEKVIDSVRHHVEEEEQEMFVDLRERTDDDMLERMGELIDKAKSVVPTHPHPLVPGTATAQLVAGPWATVVDKVRDLVEA